MIDGASGLGLRGSVGCGGDGPLVADGFNAELIAFSGGLLEGLHGWMEELVDEAAGKGFNGGKLLWRESAEAGLNAAEFGLADFFSLALEGDDGRGDVDGALILVEALDFAGDEGFSVRGFAAALGKVGGGDGLKVVDVVDEDAFELAHFGVNVAGDGDVDEEHGFVAAALHEGLAVFATKDGVGRTS
jgi:hypothetical protein